MLRAPLYFKAFPQLPMYTKPFSAFLKHLTLLSASHIMFLQGFLLPKPINIRTLSVLFTITGQVHNRQYSNQSNKCVCACVWRVHLSVQVQEPKGRLPLLLCLRLSALRRGSLTQLEAHSFHQAGWPRSS